MIFKNPVIHLVGAGGTGGYLLDYLVRIFSSQNPLGPTIHIYEGDTIEMKNITRQNFSQHDVGENKAQALVNRFETQFPILCDLVVHQNYIIDADEFLAELMIAGGNPIILSCVDNIATRKLLHQAFSEYPEQGVLIDAGNDDLGGQVVWHSQFPVEVLVDSFTKKTVQLSSFFDVYPELSAIDDDNPGLIEKSCADVVADYPQAMMANVQNATTMAIIVTELLSGATICYNTYKSSLKSGGVTPSLTYQDKP